MKLTPRQLLIDLFERLIDQVGMDNAINYNIVKEKTNSNDETVDLCNWFITIDKQ